jgi:hypothetical protein
MQADPADRLLSKVRAFVTDQLADDERPLFAALIAPGVAQAYAEDDVQGFAMTEWSASALPEALAEAVRRTGIRVVGLGEDEGSAH